MVDNHIEKAAPAGIAEARGPPLPFVPSGCHWEPGYRWLCVHTIPGGEILALQSLRKLGLCTWLPEHLSAGGRICPLFPRYLLVQADLGADVWRAIYRTPGVKTILGTHHERPASLPAHALASLWRQCAANGVIYPAEPPAKTRPIVILPGTVLELAAGPFVARTGVCEWSERERVAILLTVFGREVRVIVPRRDLSPV